MNTATVDLIDKEGAPGARALRNHGTFDFVQNDDGTVVASGVCLDVAEQMAGLFPGRFTIDTRSIGLPLTTLRELGKLAGEVVADGEERSLAVKTNDGVVIVTVSQGEDGDVTAEDGEAYADDRPVTPAAAALADSEDIDINEVIGTGKDGTVTKGDVIDFLNA